VVLSFIYLSYLWTKDIHVALIMGFIPVLTPVVLSMGFEIRAYSMESLGTVVSMVALEKLKNKLTLKHLFLWGCIFAIFMTSRYAEIFIIFLVSLYVLFLIFISKSTLNKKIISSVIYVLPLLGMLVYIYCTAFIFQGKDIKPLEYLRYLSNDVSILLETGNLIALCVVETLIVILFLKKRYPIVKRYEMLLRVTIYANILFIVLSFSGKYPWDFGWCNTRCISIFLLFGLCISAFLGELLRLLFKNSQKFKYYLIVSLLLLTLFFTKETLSIRIDDYTTYSGFRKINIASYHRIYVDNWETPYVRYLFEYEHFNSKNDNVYPSNFTFSPFWNDSLNDYLLQYDLIIISRYRNLDNSKWKRIDNTINFYVKTTGLSNTPNKNK
jgi:hypothetical protein